MKLNELVDLIKRVALSYPNIRSFYFGDIYESMNQSRTIDYDTIVLTLQNTSVVDGYLRNHTFNMFFVSRMLDDESNKLQIQSQAQEALEGILSALDTTGVLVLNERQYVNFTQKFADLCAGGFLTVTIQVPIEDCVGDDYAIVNSVGGKTGNVSLKTINGESIIGAGNIEISGGSGTSLQYYSEEGTYDLGSSAKIEVKNAYIKAEGVDGGTVTVEGSHIDLHCNNAESRIVVGDLTGIDLYTTGTNGFKYNGEAVAVASDLLSKQDVSGMTAYATTSSLAAVATSGQYSDLTGTPTFTLSGSTLIITTN